jgi:uncharacterized protein (TIGR03083 family)
MASTWDEIAVLLRRLTPADFDQPTSCPGWSVRDIVSHLSGFELMLQGAETPPALASTPTYVHNPIGEINETYVEERRSWSVEDSLHEFERVTSESLRRLRARTDEEWEAVGWSPEGPAPYHRFAETRILDSWIHLQDIRDAVAMPEDDHGTGEEIVVNRFEAAMPYVIAKRARVPDGTTVRLHLQGRLARTIAISVEGGRATAVDVLEQEPTLEISTPVALFWRRVAGRISPAAFLGSSATHVEGSQALAEQIANAMAIMI